MTPAQKEYRRRHWLAIAAFLAIFVVTCVSWRIVGPFVDGMVNPPAWISALIIATVAAPLVISYLAIFVAIPRLRSVCPECGEKQVWLAYKQGKWFVECGACGLSELGNPWDRT